ncbi:insulinase family protein [Pseudonocardiaceae bacterium YIM PH 21723]|nr:insulinase family protein [Pseudonocardiaceae bacterium YIM PH 21723]
MTLLTDYRSPEEIGRTEAGPRPLPPLGVQRPDQDAPTVDTVLANGLRVIAVRRTSVPMVELRMHIPFAGDAADHGAVSELLASTLLTGTARRNRVRFSTDLAKVGGDLSASVDPERLYLSGSALVEGTETLLDVLADAITGAVYPDGEIDRERDRLVERIAMARAQPRVIAREALQKHRYADHPFTKEVPEAAEVAQVTATQVRDLHARAMSPRGSVLVLVGDVDPAQAVAALEKALGGWTNDTPAHRLPALPVVSGGDLLLVHRPGAVQSQLRLSAQAIPRTDPRYPALQLANLVFGGYFSSRLVENIREDKGYTYSTNSSFEFTPGNATLLIDADTASEVTAAALLEARYELGRLALVPPTEQEVDSARQYAIGSLLITTSSQSGLASTLLAFAGVDIDPQWLREHPDRLRAVTTEQVAAAALEFFAPVNFTGVVVGDADLLTPSLSALGGVQLP